MNILTHFQFDAANGAAALPRLSDSGLDALDFGVVAMHNRTAAPVERPHGRCTMLTIEDVAATVEQERELRQRVEALATEVAGRVILALHTPQVGAAS